MNEQEKKYPVQAWVRTQKQRFDKEAGEKVQDPPEESQETLMVRMFITEPAKVSISYGHTSSLGNYESARVDVGITIPCYREEVDAVHDWAAKWVETRVLKERELIVKAMRDREDF